MLLLAFAAIAVAGLLPYEFGPYYQGVGYRILQLATLGMAWNLLAGYGGLFSLGSAAFVGLGSYSAAEVGNAAGLPLPLLIAVVASPAMFRLRGLHFTIGTLAVAEALRILMVNLPTFGGAAGVILRQRAPAIYDLYWWALVLAVVATVVVGLLLASPAALSLRAVRDDEDVARELGVVTFRTKTWAFAIAGGLMGAIGALQAAKLGVIEPYGAFSISWTVDIVAAAIIGGLGTKAGPWVGAAFTGVLAELLQRYPETHVAITGAVLILVIRVAPRGLWGTVAAHRGLRVG
jgi:branched-chain amino acid transport system permease protein